MRILVVDDDTMVVKAIKMRLQAEDYTVFSADDGMKALDIIENQDLDLIISDIMMPNLSGLSLLTLLKKHYANRIPVILISALDQSPVILASLGLGANDFVVKPINYDDLISRVKRFERV